jgi:multimeric flavodoxin WrbA
MNMKIVAIYGSPRKGNTYKAAQVFMDELAKCGEIDLVEFFSLHALPEFCVGCQLCLGNSHEKCPHTQYVSPVLSAMLEADAIMITSPHYGASTMPASLKNIFDHLDFLVLTVAPQEEMFRKKAFVLTTGSGSKSAVRPIVKCLRNWGINRVYARGFRMFTDSWEKMSKTKQCKFETALRRDARRFYSAKLGKPYVGTVFMYHMSKFILRRYIGKGTYPYEHWLAHGWFKTRPF